MRIFCLLLGVMLSWSASAADIRIDPAGVPNLDGITKITFRGKVAKGDAVRVEKLVAEDDTAIVFLDSSGGDYREGLALANLFKAKKIKTAVAAGRSCLSACAIAFLGGTSYGEEGTEPFARSIATTARLGFHAPFIEVSAGDLKVEQIELAYDNAIRTVTDFVRAAGDLGVTAEVAADMMTPQRADLYRIATVRDLMRTRIELQGIPVPRSITRSMAMNLCLNGWVSGQASELEIDRVSKDTAQLLKDLEWPSKSTIRVTSDYFSGEDIPIKRTVFPIAAAGEGSGYYSCMIDHVELRGELRIANRGYVFTETADETSDRAAAYGGPEFAQLTQLDVSTYFNVAAIDPLAPYDYEDEGRLGLVPLTTPIAKIVDIVAGYLATEPPL